MLTHEKKCVCKWALCVPFSPFQEEKKKKKKESKKNHCDAIVWEDRA